MLENMSVQEIIKMVEEAHEALETIRVFEEIAEYLKRGDIKSINLYTDKYAMNTAIHFHFETNEKANQVLVICLEEIVERYRTKFSELGVNLDEFKK